VGDDLAALPIGSPNAIDTARMTDQLNAAGTAIELKQVSNLSLPSPGTKIAVPLENEYEDLNTVRADDFGTYAWEQQPPIPPACQTSETVYDSLGNPRQITIQFYQVNDLGSANPPINPSPGPSQVCYAWYAFETTGGQQPTTQNLLGGTGINDGNPLPNYDRGNPALNYNGDFLWFNTDGSLASSGGMGGIVGTPAGYPNNFMVPPRIYLMPNNQVPPVSPVPTVGAQIMAVDLNFGTWGILGVGRRDGLISDAEGSYQTVNGVNTYVPQNTAYAASQNGYADGTLQGLNFDESGVIQGTFSNGQVVGLAQVVLDKVDNPDGLSKVGGNDYVSSVNSGSNHLGLAGTIGLGTIQGSALESSNVDLTVELSNMIVAQRGFEANARMVSTANSFLNTLDNLGL
jgi:flagellar hook-basal body protein